MAGLVFGIRHTEGMGDRFTQLLEEVVKREGRTVNTISMTRLLNELSQNLGCTPAAVEKALGPGRMNLLIGHELHESRAGVTIFPEMNGPESNRLVYDASVIGDGIVVHVKKGSTSGVSKNGCHRVVVTFDGTEEDLGRQAEAFFRQMIARGAPRTQR